MKIISLNTWGGEAGVLGLQDFFRAHKDVDIFCLQEVWSGGEEMLTKRGGGSWFVNRVTTLFSDIEKVLPAHTGIFRPMFRGYYGLSFFIKKDIQILDEGEFYIYREEGYISPEECGDHARILQYLTIETLKGPRTVVHLHGLWNGKGKNDSPERLEQSDRIITFLSNLKTPHILVGDFNLRPDTQSIKNLENIGLRNLIAEHKVTSTRTSHYPKEEKFADYAFVSPEIEIKDFKVLPDEVSDHSPLYLDFI